MGVTYKAFDTNLRSPAALKVINSTFLQNEAARQRFLREARAAAQLRHPNVATIYYLGHEGVENYFYAMELIEGETFDELLAREGPLPVGRALELTLQVTRALIAAHAVGLIHRDIKPSNLMLTQQHGDPIVKVIDFGLAKAIGPELTSDDSGGPHNALTRTGGGFVGTPFYASPEQLENLSLDTRSDLYSLGVTLWFLLTGRPPFTGTSLARVVSEHLTKAPPFQLLPKVPDCVKVLLERMLAKDAQNRPQTPTELRDEILACLKQVPALGPDSAAAQRGTGSVASMPTILEDFGATLAETPPTVTPAKSVAPTLEVGAVLHDRFRLDDRIGTALFRSTDLSSDQTVAVRAASAAAIAAVTALAERWPAASADCSAIVRPHAVGALVESGGGFVAVEWVEGATTLLDLVRHRGALTLGETLTLLDPLARADAAFRAHGLEGAHLELGHILLQPAADGGAAVYPRVFPAELFPPTTAANGTGNETILSTSSSVPSLSCGSDPRAFGRLACELLGGPARNWLEPDSGRFTPLSSLNEAGNVMLRRCLTAAPPGGATGDGGGDGFASGLEFVAALHRSVEGTAGGAPFSRNATTMMGLSGGARGATSVPGDLTEAPSSQVPVEVIPRSTAHSTSMGTILALVALLVVAAGGGVALWMWWGKREIRTPIQSITTSTPSTPFSPNAATPVAAAPRLTGLAPFVATEAWTNSLGMKFVPAGPTLNAGVWPVRVADFAAFITADRYDAEGGMFSVGPDGMRKQMGRTWKEPGFQQGNDSPVVGVNVADAEAFCGWLTKLERDAGLLPSNRRYRLPTDEEWSRLAGMRDEPAGLTPQQRGDKAPEEYPWGTKWPPPPRVGNYAGKEAALPAPETLAGYEDGFPRTSPVGSFAANSLGLFDMGGNVWQWCSDRFKPDANWKAARGGSWLTSTKALLRKGAREGFNPEFRRDDIGFRCVLGTDL